MPTPSFQPGQNIPIATVPNLRDLGGWPTPDGNVREGLLFRSAEFADLQGGDASAFGQLGIRSIYDMRTADERAAAPNRLPAATEYIVVDILRDSSAAAPAQLLRVLGDPRAAEELLGGGKAAALFINGYREIISLPSALSGYRQFFTEIAQVEHRPALFHCTTGKDRTGWARPPSSSCSGLRRGRLRRLPADQRAVVARAAAQNRSVPIDRRRSGPAGADSHCAKALPRGRDC